MQVKEWIKKAVVMLEKESGTANLDSEVLISHVLGVDRAWLHAYPESQISEDSLKILDKHLLRRTQHEPIAYIIEKTEFYGREFYITNGVLVPRPESETMIDEFKKHCLDKNLNNTILVDIGTGSGALIITAILETGIKNATAIDIDDRCIKVSKTNFNKHKVNVTLQKSNLLESFTHKEINDKDLVLLANLPYVPAKYSINSEAKNEPSHAIFGGEDGLDLYRQMFKQLRYITARSVTIFTESLPFQHNELINIAEKNGFNISAEEDFIQKFIR